MVTSRVDSQKTLNQGRRRAEIRLPQFGNGGRQIEDASNTGLVENAQRAGDLQTLAAGLVNTFPVVHENESGICLESEEDCILLTGVE